jgi:hypothetical protein
MIRALFRDCRAVLCLPRLWVQTRLGVPPGIRPALAPMTLTLALRALRLDALEAWSVSLWLAAAIRGARRSVYYPGVR